MRPLYPLFLAVYSVLFLWLRNLEESSAIEPILTLVVLAAAVTMAQALARRVFNNPDSGAFLVGVGVVVVLGYGHVYSLTSDAALGRHRYLLPTALLLIIAAGLIARKGIRPAFSGQAELVCALMLVMPFVTPVKLLLTRGSDAAPISEKLLLQARQATNVSDRPDVYYLILDGYARQDILRDLYALDNRPFLNDLTEMGFTVRGDAFANYPTTLSSLSSSLNASYLHGDGGILGPIDRFLPLYEAIESNRATRLFNEAGYTTTYVTSHRYANAGLDFADRVENCGPTRAFWNVWVPSTILRVNPRIVWDLFLERERLRIECQFALLGELASETGPKFVFFHVISPHPPFLFSADGSPRTNLETDLKSWNPRSSYSEQVHYINSATLVAVESILERNNRPAIIVIQSDHGPASTQGPEWRPHAEFIAERMPILLAIRPANGAEEDAPDAQSPINTVRWLLSASLGLTLSPLPERSYFTDRASPPYRFIDVTPDESAAPHQTVERSSETEEETEP